MARFINQDPFVNTTYNPRSLDDMSRLPLVLAARDEANLNAGYDALARFDNIAVPEDERARALHQQKRSELENGVNLITDTIQRNGSLDPSVMNQIRGLKANYNQWTSQNGVIGRLADARTTMDAQFIAARQDALMKGNTDEGFQAAFAKQRQDYFDNVDWNNPSRFVSTLSPDKETVENLVGRMDLGSITTSTANSGVVAVPNGDGSVTFNYTAGANASSSNIQALQELSTLISNQIKDKDSPLMQSLIYNNPNKSIEEIRQIAIEEAQARINAKVRSNTATSSSQDIRVSQANVPTGTLNPSDPKNKKPTEEDERLGELNAYTAGFEETKTFDDPNYLNRVYSGEESKRIEGLEAQLSAMPDSMKNTKDYKDLLKEVVEGKNKIASTKYQLDESINDSNNDAILNTSLKDIKNRANIFEKKLFEYKVNGKTELGKFFNNPASFRNLKKDNVNFSKAIENDSNYSRAYQSLNKAFDPYKSIDNNENFSIVVRDGRRRFIADKKRNLQPHEIEQVNKHGISTYEGKAAVKKYLELEGITFNSDEDYSKFLKLYKNKTATDKALALGSTKFFNDVYNDKGNMAFNSNILTLGTNPKTREDIDKGISAIGGGAIINDFISNDRNFIYDAATGEMISVQKMKGTDDEATIKSIGGMPDAKYSFNRIVERPTGRRSSILIDVTAGEGKEKITQTLALEINPKPGQSAQDTNTTLIKKVINTLQEPSKSLVQAIYDNSLYYNMYVDDESIGKSGVSTNQLHQIRATVDSSLLRDGNYKRVSPMVNPEKATKANVVYHNNGYFSFNYSGSDNNIKSVTMGDYILKELVSKQIGNSTILDSDRIYDDNGITSLSLDKNKGAAKRFINQMVEVMEHLDKGVMNTDATTREYVNQNYDSLKNAANDQTVESQYQIALGVYNRLKSVPLMHKNRLKGS